jgi:hypothetical protein
MVNSRNATFKVNKQTPIQGPPPEPYSTVINCRKPGGKRAKANDSIKSQQVPLTKIVFGQQPAPKRKRDDDQCEAPQSKKAKTDRAFRIPVQNPKLPKPTKFRRGRHVKADVNLDVWNTIYEYTDPGQLLEMRTKIPDCYQALSDYPKIWKRSRAYHYPDLPDPPSGLTEFQFADLRHGLGCQSCKTKSTRKTYWAFLRRWCKKCWDLKTIKEHEAVTQFKEQVGEDTDGVSSLLLKCLPSAVLDSWGNFVGTGPSPSHSYKIVYLKTQLQSFITEYQQHRQAQEGPDAWDVEADPWITSKIEAVIAQREFALKLQHWEENNRHSRSLDYQDKKDARKQFYIEQASKLTPPISAGELSLCGAYKRAIAIPKEPNMVSWMQLKPKLEKEIAEVKEKARNQADIERERVDAIMGFPVAETLGRGPTQESTPSSG